eukprot:scaffold30108_cov31-Tisochrysis_lutea.AAC.4
MGVPLGNSAADRRMLHMPHENGEPEGGYHRDEEEYLGVHVKEEVAESRTSVSDLSARYE